MIGNSIQQQSPLQNLTHQVHSTAQSATRSSENNCPVALEKNHSVAQDVAENLVQNHSDAQEVTGNLIQQQSPLQSWDQVGTIKTIQLFKRQQKIMKLMTQLLWIMTTQLPKR